MYISPDLLYFHIRESFAKSTYVKGDNPPSKSLQGIMFWSFPTKMKGHIVLIDSNSDIHFVHHYAETLFIFPSVDPPSQSLAGNAYIVLGEDISIGSAFNRIAEILNLFDIWEKNMEQAVDTYKSFNAVIRSCDSVLRSPLALMDNDFRYVAYSKTLAAESGYEELFVDEHGYLPLEYINAATSIPRYKDSMAEQHVYRVADLENGLHKNIFYAGQPVGRLTLPSSTDEVANAFSSEVLSIVSAYIERLYANMGTFYRFRSNDSQLRTLLCDLLDERIPDQRDINRLLENRGFEAGQHYYLVQFKSNMEETAAHLGESLSAYISTHWPGCLGFTYQEKTLMLANASFYAQSARQDFERAMAVFLRESLLVAGLSRSFFDLRDVRAALAQTEIALNCSEELDPMQWFPKFNSYALHHLILHGSQGFLPHQICDPAVNDLTAYDQAHGSELNETLKTYIRERYNAVAAAKALHVSRSAFLKRLARIEDAAKLNLDNPQRRLYLALSYELFDLERRSAQ